MTREIALSNRANLVALVDDDDYDLVAPYTWRAHASRPNSRTLHALAYGGGGQANQIKVRMHRLILPGVRLVDHRNGNGLDNRRENLRPATVAQNTVNSEKRRGATSSRFKGVYWDTDRGKWVARIKTEDRRVHLGAFGDETDAALAYDRAAIEAWGEFARLNLPNGADR